MFGVSSENLSSTDTFETGVRCVGTFVRRGSKSSGYARVCKLVGSYLWCHSSWVVTECDEDQFVAKSPFICLSAAEFFFPHLLMEKLTSLVDDASAEV